ncbi:hypothetical protein KIPB_002231 [Kipferlia bialata]|uniref:O-antigen ligase-related domain-containing protein n=1 Tax=Kipferlia bialata TaxID=797122 RepID=A0A9K3GF78_9EUKA|nr:hypothetical protein KIPB_001019 [Kipferlia bialata]GIQ81293.1 hypothetical protein KIPB_002231 [Kipferlia bialata]|eukprot:g1019.t1
MGGCPTAVSCDDAGMCKGEVDTVVADHVSLSEGDVESVSPSLPPGEGVLEEQDLSDGSLTAPETEGPQAVDTDVSPQDTSVPDQPAPVEGMGTKDSTLSATALLDATRAGCDTLVFRLLCFLVAAVFVWLDLAVAGVVFFYLLVCLLFVVCDSSHPTLLPFLLSTTVPLKLYDSFDLFFPLWKIVPIGVAAILFHYLVYWRKKGPVRLGPTFPASVAVSAALLIGGVGVVSWSDYLKPLTLYYSLGLGLAMVGVYVLFSKDAQGQRQSLVSSLLLWGLFAVYMLVQNYIPNWDRFVSSGYRVLDCQMSNNVSTIMVICLPFSFHLCARGTNTHYALGVGSGLLMSFGLLISSSRSGMTLAGVIFPACTLVFMYVDRPHRYHHLCVLGVLLVLVVLARDSILSLIEGTLSTIEDADTDTEPRALMLKALLESIGDFWLFGHGIGYTGGYYYPKKGGMYWYHSAPVQVVGSMGVVGVVVYGYQIFVRTRLCVHEKGSLFAVACFGSYGFLVLMSCINPGIFCPLPYALILVLILTVLEQDTEARVDTCPCRGPGAGASKGEGNPAGGSISVSTDTHPISGSNDCAQTQIESESADPAQATV